MSLHHQHGALATAICGTGIRHRFPPRRAGCRIGQRRDSLSPKEPRHSRMAALHSVQAQKEASGKVEGCGAPVEAAPADARRHGRPPHRRAALFGFPPLKEEATAQAILTRRTLLRAGASAAVTPLGCIEGASVPIAEAPLHSGIARLDAKARQQGAALRDPGAPPNLTQPPSGCAFHPRCGHHAAVRDSRPGLSRSWPELDGEVLAPG